MAESLAGSLRLTIGVLRGPATPRLAPLLHAVTLTLAKTADSPTPVVDCPDPEAALENLEYAVRRNPRASVALGRLLRHAATKTHVVPNCDSDVSKKRCVAVLYGRRIRRSRPAGSFGFTKGRALRAAPARPWEFYPLYSLTTSRTQTTPKRSFSIP
ncbi:hypothetical protein [Nocardia abscessus]|uniref:hypothetical protein n=1 Tax=Nocardia abscessus TaxID=120957 RepID=UPI0024590F97|nr:hypothetical protein [Nocardia abscessus]